MAEDYVIYSLIGSSMRSILHPTGVCVMSQSDFSGVKSKKHGIHHQEAKTQQHQLFKKSMIQLTLLCSPYVEY